MFERVLVLIDSSKNLEVASKYAIKISKKIESFLKIKTINSVCVLK
tara:strand:+ start:871 stop:1008 length:138 start_codon:yes stop_codon:yes gene_type:complete